MDFNNKPEQGFGGNDNIFDNNQTFDNTNAFDNNQSIGNNATTNSAPTYNAGNGVYTPNPAPMNNTYSGGNNYYSNPTPTGANNTYINIGGEKETPVSVGDWMLSYLVMCIPCVGLIMMFVWAFSSGTKKSKSNYFKAMLIWALIGTVLMVIVYGLMFAGIIAASDSYYYYGFIQNVIATI